MGINRRRVVTINDGKPGERSVSMACMHCTDAPCAAVCPVTCIYPTDDGIVLHNKDLLHRLAATALCLSIGAPQYPKVGNFGSRGKMDKCTYLCRVGGAEASGSAEEFENTAPTGRRSKLRYAPRCAPQGLCWRVMAHHCQIYKARVFETRYGSGAWGWMTAYHEASRSERARLGGRTSNAKNQDKRRMIVMTFPCKHSPRVFCHDAPRARGVGPGDRTEARPDGAPNPTASVTSERDLFKQVPRAEDGSIFPIRRAAVLISPPDELGLFHEVLLHWAARS